MAYHHRIAVFSLNVRRIAAFSVLLHAVYHVYHAVLYYRHAIYCYFVRPMLHLLYASPWFLGTNNRDHVDWLPYEVKHYDGGHSRDHMEIVENVTGPFDKLHVNY
jgi:hypothetical protein